MLYSKPTLDEILGYSHHRTANFTLHQHPWSNLASPRASLPTPTPVQPSTSHQVTHSTRKRARHSENTNGEASELRPRKKRRLRRDLVTSRLSRPYAVPPTFIPSPKGLRTAVWARQRISGRTLVRKAAIFNSIAMKRRSSDMPGVHDRHLARGASLIA